MRAKEEVKGDWQASLERSFCHSSSLPILFLSITRTSLTEKLLGVLNNPFSVN